MSLFKPVTNDQAFAKVGVQGLAGSGKTYTAMLIAVGIINMMKLLKLATKNRIVMLDTESGSSWIKPMIAAEGIDFSVSKSRSFTDLLAAIPEAETSADVLLIDSMTHYWAEFIAAFRRDKNIKGSLSFHHWGILKPEWTKFTTLFLNSQVHIIMCGRGGYEYEFFEDDSGKMQLQKTGTKMKVESETAFEPSLNIEMERIKDPDLLAAYEKASKYDKPKVAEKLAKSKNSVRRCYILKDRSTLLDGKIFHDPTFKDFAPHWEALNLGGVHFGVDTTQTEAGHFDADGESYAAIQRRIKIVLENIQGELVALWPGTDKWDKAVKAEILYLAFDTRSWTAVEGMKEHRLSVGLDGIRELGNATQTIDRERYKDARKYAADLWAEAQKAPDAKEMEGPGQQLEPPEVGNPPGDAKPPPERMTAKDRLQIFALMNKAYAYLEAGEPRKKQLKIFIASKWGWKDISLSEKKENALSHEQVGIVIAELKAIVELDEPPLPRTAGETAEKAAEPLGREPPPDSPDPEKEKAILWLADACSGQNPDIVPFGATRYCDHLCKEMAFASVAQADITALRRLKAEIEKKARVVKDPPRDGELKLQG